MSSLSSTRHILAIKSSPTLDTFLKHSQLLKKRHPFGVQEKIVDLFVDIVALCEAAQLIILIFTNCTTVLSPFCIFCCCDEISNP